MMLDSPRFHPDVRSIPRHSKASLGDTSKNVEIGGNFDGVLDGRSITVLEGASVSGELGGDLIEIHGFVRGKLRGIVIHVKPTALIEGELEYHTLLIEPGATVNAHCTPN